MSWFICCMCKEKTVDVRELDLNRMGLCEVPPEVFSFERTLEILHLEGNKIIELPRTLFQCEELKQLNVSDNEIGTIPPLISKLANLQILYLSRNYLNHVDISSNISRCQKLTVLDLSSNNLNKVPEALASLVNLQQLYLNDTFIDFVPANFGRLHNLKILELRDNMLNTLPKSFKRLNLLQRLDLSNNELGEIPEVIGNMQNLTELWINSNSVTAIHANIGNLRKLIDFDASQNDIEELPKEIGQWTKMTTLVLSHNCISTIPHVIGNLRNLQTLNLESNFLCELPVTIGKLANLEELNLQDNCLASLPSSIGFLRKLVFLVVSCNRLTNLPPEIGSCTSLSVLNLHNNAITRLPEEVGHLQKLTSLGLIGNKLEYLPIPISNLPLLRALWLTQNQSHPLIPLQTEQLENTGQLVLTCFLLPQIQLVPSTELKAETVMNISTQSRRICFKEPGTIDELPTRPRLTRAPTPYPKDLQRYERSVNNMLRKQRETHKSHSINLNLDSNTRQIKEAKVTPMKANVDVSSSLDNEEEAVSGLENINKASGPSSSVEPIGVRYTSYQDQDSVESSHNDGHVTIDEIKKSKFPGPPPYHIAAIYSKNAHFFNNTVKSDISEDMPVDKPRHFIQDQPANILMPQPQHPPSFPGFTLKQNVHKQNVRYSNDVRTYMENDVVQAEQQEMEKRRESNWLFGNHKNRRILEVTLTPCCYVLGFTVKYNETGVFVDEVHKDGNAYQKLHPGDKIVIIDDIDLARMEPETAAKIVLMRGPEAENITISRNI